MSAFRTRHREIDRPFATVQGSVDPAVAVDAFARIDKTGCNEARAIALRDCPDLRGASEAVKYAPGKGFIFRNHLDKIRVE